MAKEDVIGPKITDLTQLTEREHEAWSLIAEALEDKEIAVRMGIKPNTVKTYLKRIYGKMEFRNRVAAAVCYVRTHEGTLL